MGLLSILAAADPVEHVVDKPLWKMRMYDGAVHLGPLTFDGEWWIISNATVMLVFAAIVACLLLIPAAKRITTGPRKTLEDFRSKGLLANLVESVCVYLRDQVFKPVLEDQTDRFAPILWTFFFFILICNLLGLIPFADLTGLLGVNHGHGIGGTATQSIWVTAGLAAVSFIFYNTTAFLKDPKAFLLHMTGGAPWYMWVLMVPVEIIGMFVKPFALALRLFANMTGGHIVLAVFLGLVAPLIRAMGAIGYPLAVAPMLGALAISLMEVLVAFIQAYIFTFLSCLFLGQLVVHEHEEHAAGHGHEGHDHGHDHGHAHGAHGHSH